MASHRHARNPGCPLDLAWVLNARVNKPAVLRRAASHAQRRTVKKQAQMGWILRCVSLIDLTTLSGDDTKTNVERLCHKALRPVRDDLREALGLERGQITTGAVCVYPSMVKHAVAALEGSGVPVASVATNFPSGQLPLHLKVAEIKYVVEAGAAEVDIVISRELVSGGRWAELYEEVRQYREACGEAHLKTILSVGELPTFRSVFQASLVCMMAGADVIKTSTGKDNNHNATLGVSLVMLRAIREFHERLGHKVGFKPAGGIRDAKTACAYLALMKEELGDDWCRPDLFRIGASGLLLDCERQLSHGLTGQYAAKYYMSV